MLELIKALGQNEIVQKLIGFIRPVFKYKSYLYITFSVVFIYLIVFHNFLWLFGNMPSVKELKNPKLPTASEIYSQEGILIGKYYRENRAVVEMSEVSPFFIDALLATEDIRFYEHHGVDWRAIGSVVWYSIKGDKRGGSTLTQQLAKNLFKTRKSNQGLFSKIPIIRTLVTKMKEWIVAIRLEKNYSKEHILTLYINTVDFGNNSFGVKAASKTFFNKNPKNLTVQESATLVGVLKATTSYNPILHPEQSLERRNIVLGQMKKYEKISEELYKQLLIKPIKLDIQQDNPSYSPVPYIRAAVANQLEAWCSENGYDLYADGLKIYTTIDMQLQKHAEKAMKQHMLQLQNKFDAQWGQESPWRDEKKQEIEGFLEKAIRATSVYKSLAEKYKNQPDSIEFYLRKEKKCTLFSLNGKQVKKMDSYDSLAYYKKLLRSGFVSMNPTTGEIKSWVGGMDYNTFQLDYINQTKRQPGSTFKPFVYATAIEQGAGPCDTRIDEPIRYEYEEDGELKVWEPRNSNRVFTFENKTLRRAMAQSINSITARLTQEVDPKNVMKMAKKCGIESDISPVPSIGLGTGDVSLLELVKSYAPFVNGGYRITPILVSRIEDKEGNTIATFESKNERVLDEETAWLMSYMFRGTTDEYGGTSQALFSYPGVFNNRNHVGGKTGTSNNYSDGWYIGLTRDLIGGIWVGAEDRSVHFKNSASGEAMRTALPMWGIFLQDVYRDKTSSYKPSTFPESDKVIEKPHSCWSPGPPKDTSSVSLDSTLVQISMDSLRKDSTSQQ